MRYRSFLQIMSVLLLTASFYVQAQEIMPTRPPRLSREEIYHTMLSGNLPDSYWARAMKGGDARITDKVVYRRPSLLRPLVPAISRKGVATLSPQGNDVTGTALVDWVVNHEFGQLSSSRRDTLRNRFRSISAEAASVQRLVTEGAIAPLEGQKQISALLARLLRTEHAVIGEDPLLYRQRHGVDVDSAKAMPSEQILGAGILPFIDGASLQNIQLPRGGAAAPRRSAGGLKANLTNLPVPTAGNGIQVIEYDQMPPEYAALEGRIFIAEHPVFESWDWGIAHSSIVAGIWRLKIERKIVETREYSAGGASGSPDGQQGGVRTVGRLISKTLHTIKTWQFYDWAWANGCAGGYANGDKLTLAERICCDPADDIELLMRSLYSYTPAADSEYSLSRATAYSLGMYGLNYVCHQTANAFMQARRGYEPVSHWYSYLLYGVVGSKGTSTDPDHDVSHLRGCVPGNWCEGNHSPYIGGYLEPVAAKVEDFAVGDGYGLGVVWNPTHGWIVSQALYNFKPVSIQPDDDPPEVTTENLPLE
jgi:hypothetical protein